MSARGKGFAVVARFIRGLRGGSQPILAQASDGLTYVVKFINNPQGPNVLFNESAGTELYRAFGLSVPQWKPLFVSDSFIDDNPDCWMQTANRRQRPESGLCFGSRFVGGDGGAIFEWLPNGRVKRVRNRSSFWLAWMVDICADHMDGRQAVYLEDAEGNLTAFFVDHGFMFGGPNGDKWRSPLSGRCVDRRVYGDLSPNGRMNLRRIAKRLNVDRLWRRIEAVTGDWKTQSALAHAETCLNRLSNGELLRALVDKMFEAPGGFAGCMERTQDIVPRSPILPVGLQAARPRVSRFQIADGCMACN